MLETLLGGRLAAKHGRNPLWPAGQDVVDRFLRDAKIDIVAVDEELAARAMSGWRNAMGRFGIF